MVLNFKAGLLRFVAMGSYTPLCKPDCLCSCGVVPEGAVASCAALGSLRLTLTTVFRFQSFRPEQLECVLPALHGKDVFVRMATGAGKSVAMFMVPLAYSNIAVGVIISPLNSLMDEQVSSM